MKRTCFQSWLVVCALLLGGCGSASNEPVKDSGSETTVDPVTTTIEVLGSLQEVGAARPSSVELQDGETMVGGQGPSWSGASARVTVTNNTEKPIVSLVASVNAMVPGLHARQTINVTNPWKPALLPGETRQFLVNFARPHTPSPSSGSGTASVTTRRLVFLDELKEQTIDWYLEQPIDPDNDSYATFLATESEITDKPFMLVRWTGEGESAVLNVIYLTISEARDAVARLENAGYQVQGLPEAE